MGKIHELSETLSNQIAAGEVIERPASVVKELVENAVDAHATRIDVFVQQAGLKQIQIVDNGDGIEADDVPVAFKRHSTSKISNRRDLFKIRSLGFRGEALASIASVADVVLETQTEEQTVGVYSHISGGEVVETKKSAVRKGTTLTVNNLFFNTPARLKYVKSRQTELAHITDIVDRLALGHPEIAFSLVSDSKQILKTAGNHQIQQTIASIYGDGAAKQMIPIENSNLDYEISGYFSKPELTRSSRNYISILINGRYIKNSAITKAIIMGYGSKLMVGRYPIVVLEIKMDPLLVDVNVHPTKQEVRLSKENELTNLIESTIKTKLSELNLIPDVKPNLLEDLSNNLQTNLNQISKPFVETTISTRNQEAVQQKERSLSTRNEAKSSVSLPFAESNDRPIFKDPARLAQWDEKVKADQTKFAFRPKEEPTVAENQTLFDEKESQTERFPELQYLGQVHGTYLLAQGPDGFYIVDQHAAQERCKYEYYRVKFGEVSDDQQSLLMPITLDYSPDEAIKIKANLDVLLSIGIELESFGQNTFVVHQHPTWIQSGQEESTIRELIAYVLDNPKATVAQFREAAAIMVSCKASIKANHYIDPKQAQSLLHDLAQTENPFNCPHGRPTLVHFTDQQLEKMFKRIQDPHQHPWEV